ncbi:MAG TPA: flagellar assembly protein FliW [Vicinamibacterales bacterium]|nr:flagellar assembly protein FliW [Vicinamibacterales bacterium]
MVTPAELEIVTRFGTFTVDPGDVMTFAHGVPGFERCRRFVLVSAPSLDPFTCLHGIDAPEPSFLTLDPSRVVSGYDTPLSDGDRHRLGARVDEPLLWLAIVHIDETAARVNLKAPVVINPRRMVGLQVMAADTAYTTDHPLDGA